MCKQITRESRSCIINEVSPPPTLLGDRTNMELRKNEVGRREIRGERPSPCMANWLFLRCLSTVLKECVCGGSKGVYRPFIFDRRHQLIRTMTNNIIFLLF